MTKAEIHLQFMAAAITGIVAANIRPTGLKTIEGTALQIADAATQLYLKRWPSVDCQKCSTKGALCAGCSRQHQEEMNAPNPYNENRV